MSCVQDRTACLHVRVMAGIFTCAITCTSPARAKQDFALDSRLPPWIKLLPSAPSTPTTNNHKPIFNPHFSTYYLRDHTFTLPQHHQSEDWSARSMMASEDSIVHCPNPACESANTSESEYRPGLVTCQDCTTRFVKLEHTDDTVVRKEWQASGKLRRAIKKFRLEFRKCDKKPPLDFKELVMMALCHKGPMTALEIHEWIHESFKWFRTMAYQTAWAEDRNRFTPYDLRLGTSHPYKSLPTDIHDVLRDLNCPFQKVKGDALGVNFMTDKWAIKPFSASSYLNKSLNLRFKKRKEPFRIMDLPAELRVMIYEEVLQFPPSGVLINTKWKDMEAAVVSRDFGAPMDLTCWNQYAHRPAFKDALLSKRLELFLVSRLVYKEAMPVFFGINHFVFSDIDDLNHFLTTTPSHRLQYIKHLSFNWGSHWLPTKKTISECAKIMKNSMPHLSEIDMLADEARMMAEKKNNGEPKYTDVTKIPVFEVLRSVRGMKRVSMQGDCDKIRNLLVAEMTRPKVGAKSKHTKKRKAEGAAKDNGAADGAKDRKTKGKKSS